MTAQVARPHPRGRPREATGVSPAADAADRAVPSPVGGGSQVVVVAGVIPGVGASGLAVGVAGAAAGAGLGVRVIDAACPRRSALRELCDTQGREHPAGPGTGVVTSTGGRVVVQHVHGGLDARVDDPGPWQAGYDQAPTQPVAVVTVIDLGVSVEEALTLEVGRTWLTGPVAGEEAWLVLATAGTTGCLRRVEAVLAAWSRAGLLPVAQVILTGPGGATCTTRARAGFYAGQALDRAATAAWHPDVYGPAYTPASLTGPLTQAGQQILTCMGGPAARAVTPVPGPSRHGLIRRRRTTS